MGRKKVNLSQVFAGQNVGVREEEDNIWLVSFMQYDIGYFDLDACRVEPLENPFGPKVLTMSPAPCVRIVVASFEVESYRGENSTTT